jgi:hypothetical protein
VRALPLFTVLGQSMKSSLVPVASLLLPPFFLVLS